MGDLTFTKDLIFDGNASQLECRLSEFFTRFWSQKVLRDWDKFDAGDAQFNLMPAYGGDIIVFPAILWKLFENKTIFVISLERTEALNRRINIQQTCRWVYRLDESVSNEAHGFDDRDLGALIPTPNIWDFFDVQALDLGDSVSEINMIVFDNQTDGLDQVVSALTGSAKPKLEKILRHCFAFVYLCYSMEPQIEDCCRVMTTHSLYEKLNGLTSSFNQRAHQFEQRTDKFTTVDELYKDVRETFF